MEKIRRVIGLVVADLGDDDDRGAETAELALYRAASKEGLVISEFIFLDSDADSVGWREGLKGVTAKAKELRKKGGFFFAYSLARLRDEMADAGVGYDVILAVAPHAPIRFIREGIQVGTCDEPWIPPKDLALPKKGDAFPTTEEEAPQGFVAHDVKINKSEYTAYLPIVEGSVSARAMLDVNWKNAVEWKTAGVKNAEIANVLECGAGAVAAWWGRFGSHYGRNGNKGPDLKG